MGSIQLTASRHILPFAAFLDQNGQPVGPLLHQAGLPDSCLDDPKTLVPTQALWQFRELTAIRTGLPNLTLNVMEPFVPVAVRSAPRVVRLRVRRRISAA